MGINRNSNGTRNQSKKGNKLSKLVSKNQYCKLLNDNEKDVNARYELVFVEYFLFISTIIPNTIPCIIQSRIIIFHILKFKFSKILIY